MSAHGGSYTWVANRQARGFDLDIRLVSDGPPGEDVVGLMEGLGLAEAAISGPPAVASTQGGPGSNRK